VAAAKKGGEGKNTSLTMGVLLTTNRAGKGQTKGEGPDGRAMRTGVSCNWYTEAPRKQLFIIKGNGTGIRLLGGGCQMSQIWGVRWQGRAVCIIRSGHGCKIFASRFAKEKGEGRILTVILHWKEKEERQTTSQKTFMPKKWGTACAR